MSMNRTLTVEQAIIEEVGKPEVRDLIEAAIVAGESAEVAAARICAHVREAVLQRFGCEEQ
jgi:hypothetical protein